MNVLVVENSAGQQNALCDKLQRRDHTVLQVCGQREAIARAKQTRYELIILDLGPGSSSSLLALHRMRELERDSTIIVLTTPEQIGERVTALIQGADDYLVKPVSTRQLDALFESLQTDATKIQAR